MKDNIKNSIDLNSGNNTKDFTITLSSSQKNDKNSNIDNSLNLKSYKIRDVPENKKNPENKNSVNGTVDFTATSSNSYNDYKITNTDGNTSNVNNDKTPIIQESRKTP